MESDSDYFRSSDDDDDYDEVVMILNSAILITAHDIESDSDSTALETKLGGSPKGKARNILRDFQAAYIMLINNYFNGAQSIYNEVQIEWRFGTPCSVVMRLWGACNGVYTFTKNWYRATKRFGIQPLVQFVGALRMIKYGDCADRLDAHLQMSQIVCNESMKAFCKVVVNEFKN